jgi:signal peptidase I
MRQGEFDAAIMPPNTEGFLTSVASGSQLSNVAVTCALARELVRNLGFVQLPATGTSMVPAIHPGDLLWVRRVDPGEISAGDIVVYARQERLIVHRVVSIRASSSREPYLITRGDRLVQDDARVLWSELLGLVTSLERGHRFQNLPPQLKATERAIRRVLRCSDRATYLYLRASAFWRGLLSRGSVCQA